MPRGLSHYPQHIIAQAEAQKGQQLATQQTKESGANSGPSSSSSSPQQGCTSPTNATLGNHVQIALLPASSSEGLNIQHYQPIQQVQTPSQGPEKRAARSSINTNTNTSASSASSRSIPTSTRGSQRQAQQQQQVVSAAPDTSMPSSSEVTPKTSVGIMSQFPVPGLVDTPHPAGG